MSWALQWTSRERRILCLSALATALPLFVLFVEIYFENIFFRGYPFRCSALVYTNVSCCAVFFSTLVGAPLLGLLLIRRIVMNIVAQCRRREAYARLPVQQLSPAQHFTFNVVGFYEWRSSLTLNPRNQFVLDPTKPVLEPFSSEQVATFMLDQKGFKILWLDFGNFYLGALTFSDNWKPVLAFKFDPDTDERLISLLSRDDVTADTTTTWPSIDLLLSLGTTSQFFKLYTLVFERKLFTAKGLRGFLMQSPNLKTLELCIVSLDTECCRLLGNTSHSPLSLGFTHCQLENLQALGDGMRLNGGPTELRLDGTGFLNSSVSLGSLTTNTKLESLIWKGFPCIYEVRMESVLSTLSAQGLRRIEFDTPTGGTGFESHAWATLWRCLSTQPSVTTLSFIETGAFRGKPIVDALSKNFMITTIRVTQPELSDESATYWNEHVYSCLKRNRKLVHFTRVYRLVRENVQSLVNGEWDMNRAADSDGDAGFAMYDKVE
jgi:hypothetical protein